MNDNLKEKLTVCIEKGGQRDQAEAFANRYSVTIEEEPGEELTLLFDAKGISLTGYGLTYQGDFEGMVHRISNGRLQHEMLVRAAKSTEQKKTAIAATAGMGEYSLLLGNAKGFEGPKAMGTYLWVEVENIKRLEAKLVEGPYIHHCVGIHKNVVPVLYEACKYIGVTPDLYDPIEEDVKAYLRGE